MGEGAGGGLECGLAETCSHVSRGGKHFRLFRNGAPRTRPTGGWKRHASFHLPHRRVQRALHAYRTRLHPAAPGVSKEQFCEQELIRRLSTSFFKNASIIQLSGIQRGVFSFSKRYSHFYFIYFFKTPFLYLFISVIYLFLAALGLRCRAQAFSSCGEQGLLFVAVRGLLTAVASLVAEHGL